MNVLSKVFVDIPRELVYVCVAVLRILRVDRLAHVAKTLLPPWPLWPTLPSSAKPTTTFKALEDEPHGHEEQEGGQSPREESSPKRMLSPCRINEDGVPTYEALHYHQCVKPTIIDEIKFPGIDVDDEKPEQDGYSVDAVFNAVEKAVMKSAGRAQEAVVAIATPLVGGSSDKEQEMVETPMPTATEEPNETEADDSHHGEASVGSKRKESTASEWETPQQKRPKAVSEPDGSSRSVWVGEETTPIGREKEDIAGGSTILEESSGLAAAVEDDELIAGAGHHETEAEDERGVDNDDELKEKSPASRDTLSGSTVSKDLQAHATSAGETDASSRLPPGEPRLEESSGLEAAVENNRANPAPGDGKEAESEPTVGEGADVEGKPATSSYVLPYMPTYGESDALDAEDRVPELSLRPCELSLEESSGLTAALTIDKDSCQDLVESRDAAGVKVPEDARVSESGDHVTTLPREQQTEDTVRRGNDAVKTKEELPKRQTNAEWEESSGLEAPLVEDKSSEDTRGQGPVSEVTLRHDDMSASPLPSNTAEPHAPPALAESSGEAAALALQEREVRSFASTEDKSTDSSEHPSKEGRPPLSETSRGHKLPASNSPSLADSVVAEKPESTSLAEASDDSRDATQREDAKHDGLEIASSSADVDLEESSGLAAAYGSDQSYESELPVEPERTTTGESAEPLTGRSHEKLEISLEDRGESPQIMEPQAPLDRLAPVEAETDGPILEESSGLAAAMQSPPRPVVPDESAPSERSETLQGERDEERTEKLAVESQLPLEPSFPLKVISTARPHAAGTLISKDRTFRSPKSSSGKQPTPLTSVLETPEVHSLALTAPSASAFGLALRGPNEASPPQHSVFEDLRKTAKGVVASEASPSKAATSTFPPRPERESVRSNDTEDTESDRHLEEIDSNEDGDHDEDAGDLLTVRDSAGNPVAVLAHVIKVDEVEDSEATLGPVESEASLSSSGEWSSSDSERSDSEDPAFSAVPPALQKRVISTVYYTL